jgi:protein-L-isoaspartate O-methyltransferase
VKNGIGLLCGFLLLCGLLFVPACSSSSSSTTHLRKIVLLLPTFNEYPDRTPPRLTRVKVDGEETVLPVSKSAGRHEIGLDLDDERPTLTLELSFWPVAYSNTIRTRKITLEKKPVTTVDFRVEDPEQPDEYRAIFFETAESLLWAIMDLGEVNENDTVLDIGCGDGRLVLAALQKRKAKAGHGVDIDPELVELCKKNAAKAGLSEKTQFREENALKMTDVSYASFVFLYLGEDLSAKLQPLLQKTLKPGSRVVSLDFPIGDWQPDTVRKVTAKNNHGRQQTFSLYLYRVK